MQRRKFIVGLGSLAAGGAAAIGTGAISASGFNRDLTGKVVNDSNGYVQVVEGSKNKGLIEYQGGEAAIALNEPEDGPDPEGKGVNSDSINYFDGLMNIKVMHEQSGANRNNGGSQPAGGYWYWITTSRTRLKFYFDSVRPPSGSIMGPANARKMQFVSPGSPPENIEYWIGRVGLCVDLEDSGLSPGQSLDDLFTGDENFRIHIDDEDPSP
ncbi:MAG: hypothetical protein ABEJ70_08965 [Halobacteriaceae archaeon]